MPRGCDSGVVFLFGEEENGKEIPLGTDGVWSIKEGNFKLGGMTRRKKK